MLGRESRSLQVKHNKGVVQSLPGAIADNAIQVIHEVCFHPIDQLDIRPLRNRMIGAWKRLYHSMVRDRDCLMPPGRRFFDDIGNLRNPIHVAHLGVAMKFHPFSDTVIHPCGGEILDLADPAYLLDRQFPVVGIYEHHALDL